MRRLLPAAVLVVCVSVACGHATSEDFGAPSGGGTSSSGGATASSGGGGSSGGTGTFGDGGATGDASASTSDPTTCAEAAAARSYLGCDYWPTTLSNFVWSIFDFAVVVANPQQVPATVTLTGPAGYTKQVSVAPGTLTKVYLPWDDALKGPQWDTCTDIPAFTASIASAGAAYHLVSSVPVTVYQFNALEYAPQGGPSGKNWSSCPGDQACQGTPYGCFSFSNDASLLLPTTALTGDYRLMGVTSSTGQGSYFAVTGTQDGTKVTVKLSQTARVAAGGGLAATQGPGTVTFTLNAADVVEIAGPGASTTEDLSGSLLTADKPVQVIAGHPCLAIPQDDPNATCDHVEQSVFPAETLGKHYVVVAPTGPKNAPVGHRVRVYGNVDGTHLTYSPSRPSGCPATIDAGAVVDCGVVGASFEVEGDHEFDVGMIQQSADVVDPGAAQDESEGDPSLSFATPVEQFRSDYIFLAPGDYDMSFADVVVAAGTTLTLDGTPVTATPLQVGASFSVLRVPLSVGSAGGTHVMSGNQPFGIQVIGYGQYTSYQYPGGLDLRSIAPAPAQ